MGKGYVSPSTCSWLFPDVIQLILSFIVWSAALFFHWSLSAGYYLHVFSPEHHTIKGHEYPVVLLIMDFLLIGELFKLVQRLGKRSNASPAVAAE